MGEVFEKQQRERDVKMFDLGVELTLKAIKLLKSGQNIDEVKNQTSLPMENIQKLYKLLF